MQRQIERMREIQGHLDNPDPRLTGKEVFRLRREYSKLREMLISYDQITEDDFPPLDYRCPTCGKSQ